MIADTDVVSMTVSIVLKATIIVAAGLMGAWLARGSRAAVRHAVLAASFAVLLGLPVASMVVPPVRIAVPVAPAVFVEAVDVVPQIASSSVRIVEVPSVSRWTWPSAGALLLAGWFAGAVFFLLRMMVGLRQVHSLRRYGLPWREGQVMVDHLALDVGIRRRVDGLVHESLPAPVTCGVVHPAIVLPPDAQNWAASDLNRALVHELEHVRRGDWAVHCVARVVCAAYWFHPLVWMAWRRLALEAERACDDAVLSGSDATLYADQLVGLARRLSGNRKSPALAMASRSDLSARVGAVLDSGQRRGRAGKMLVATACIASLTAVITMSPLRMVAAPQSASASGQARPAFDVASVRLNISGSDKAYNQALPGRLEMTNVALKRLILSAYGGQDDQISGDPPWAASDHYDIRAKADGNASVQLMEGPMLQVLLEDRFKLKVHREIRQLPVYELTVAKSGLKMQASKAGSCVPYSVDSPPPPPVAPGEPHPVFCGFPKLGIAGLNRTLDGVGVSMETLAGNLSRNYASALNRTVIDKTALADRYDLHLAWSIEAATSPADSGISDGVSTQPAPSIFTAIQEQLGLKLESARGPVDVLVIDHVERPSEN